MKKYYLQLSILLLSLFSTVAVSMAQTISVNGVVRTEVQVKGGKLILYLPDDIRAGDRITGTISAEPNGNSPKEMSRNKALLSTYKVSLAGMEFIPVPGQRQPMNITATTEMKLSVSDQRSATISNFIVMAVNDHSSTGNGMNVAPFALTGSPVRITGNFDGDMANTKCRLDGKPMEILAESPRQVVCAMPQTQSGQHAITVEERGTTKEKNISAVNMDLSATKTNLRRGENTRISVELSGLQGISSSLNINLTNTSPSTISLAGGNTQNITVAPSQVSNKGIYTHTIAAQSLSSGTFTVNAELQLPETASGDNTDSVPGFKWIPGTARPSTPVKYRKQIIEVIPGQPTGEGPVENTPGPKTKIKGDTSLPEPNFPKDKDVKKNCDKELADLEAARAALKNAQQAQADAQKALDDWNKQNGTELDYLNSIMGDLQKAALAAVKAEEEAKQALVNAMKQGLASGPGKNDGLAFAKGQLTESLDHYTEVQPGIFVNSYNPFNNQSKSDWDKHVKNEINKKLSGNQAVADQLKKYNTAMANKAAADQKLKDADARREALSSQRATLTNALNDTKAAVDRAAADLKEKEDAYKKCMAANI